MFTLLKNLCEITAPSGCENRLHDVIRAAIQDYVDEIQVDSMGNLIAHKKGDGKKLMFCAHTDEIGLIVTAFSKEGGVYVSALGGISPHAALYQRVQFTGGATGVLVPDGKLEDITKNLTVQNMYVDIGASSEEEAEATVSLGESAGFIGSFIMQGDTVVSKALDDRVGCLIMIETIRRLKENHHDLYFVFTAAEELGLRGAKAVASTVCPDYAVAIDVTKTGDIPSTGKMAVEMGKGVAIKIKDSSFLAHPLIKNKMKEICQRDNIPYQLEVLDRGGTDAGAIHTTCGGVPSGCISIPTRYIHSPGEMVHKQDIESAICLATALATDSLEA
ncbi:MAG: M42 family metallopeptidase [Ruminococcaceae bacterium]|nr:M42 family metallopeptidase [Oscillospiraceae bacterium]